MGEQKSDVAIMKPAPLVSQSPNMPPDPDTHWDYTQNLRLNVPLEFYEEKLPDGTLQRTEFYQGRRIIARDTPIDGGVYLTSGFGEAIVVDSEKYPRLEAEYQKLKRELGDEAQLLKAPINHLVLDKVFHQTRG